MKTIRMSTDMFAMIIDGNAIENIFTDESMRNEVNPIEYYGLTVEQVDLFLFHVWYNENTNKLLSVTLSDIFSNHGKNAMQQAEYKLYTQYTSEWEHVRMENGIIKKEDTPTYKFKQTIISKVWNDLDPEQASVIEDIINYDDDFERMIHDVEHSYPSYANTFINYIYNK